MSWLKRLLGRHRREREHREELRFHLEEHTRDLVAGGMDPREARRTAQTELKNLTGSNEHGEAKAGFKWLEDIWLDCRLALRKMRRAPSFAFAAILTIAVGVGANGAVFSVVDALLLRTLPVSDPEELYILQRVGINDDNYRFSHPSFIDLKESLSATGEITALSSLSRMYAMIDGRLEGVVGQLVDGDWFATLGVGTLYGRPLTAADDVAQGAHPVAVVSHRFWRRQLGADPSVVGNPIRVNGVLLNVVGVTEPGFMGLTVGREVDVWAPLTMQYNLKYRGNASSSNSNPEEPWLPQRGIEWLTLVGRIEGSTPPIQFETGINQVFRADLEDLYATQDSTSRQFLLRERVAISSLSRGMSPLRDQFANPLVVLMASVAMVLIIACANLASLLVARSAAETHEYAIQLSLGAQAGRLARQTITHSLLLALIGGVASLVIARWGGALLLQTASNSTQGIPLTLSLNFKLLAFSLGTAVLTGLCFGIAPALWVARTDLHAHFKTGGRVVGSPGRNPLSVGRVLVVSQLALSLVLATAAGLFARTLFNLVAIDPGYERENVVLARVDVQAGGFTSDQLPSLYQQLTESVRGVPGVSSASVSLTGLAFGSQRVSGFNIPGENRPPDWDNDAQENAVSVDFFATVGLPILRGRGFTPSDNNGEEENILVNEAAAQYFFGTVDVIGRRLGYGEEPRFTIVGVVRDAKVNNLRETPPRMVFRVLGPETNMYIGSVEARFTGPAELAAESLRRAIAAVDPELPVREVTPLNELLTRGLRTEEFVSKLAGLFGVLAIGLAAIGLYGVTSYSVSRRTNEMGVRLALGAAPGAVRQIVFRDTLVIVTAGLVLGAVLLVPTLALIRNLIYGLSPHDPMTLLGATALLVGVGLVASAVPAWRASRVDPVAALRMD